MKKLRLNKLFHWLYAFLMFVPFFVVLGNFIQSFGIGFDSSGGIFSIQSFLSLFESGTFGFVRISDTIWSAYMYLLDDIFGFGDMADCICSLLTYWTVVSAGYLIFDVLMYPINLFHRWIDEGGI